MRERIKTGVGLAAFVAVVFLLDSFFLNFIIISAILLLAFKEASALWGVQGGCALAFVSWAFLVLGVFTNPLLCALLAILVVSSALAYFKADDLKPVLPFIYPALPIFMLWQLYSEYGIGYLAWVVIAVVASDSAAYFVGRAFGKRAFSQSSPNKTIEGVVGGVAAGSIIGWVAGNFMVDDALFALLASFFICAFGVFGDLFESYLKRLAGVKDSGNILPGHGGVLDRMDGYLFGALALIWAMTW